MTKITLLLFIACSFISCNNENLKIKEKELSLREREIAIREKELELVKEKELIGEKKIIRNEAHLGINSVNTSNIDLEKSLPTTKSQFIFIVINTKEPVLIHVNSEIRTTAIGNEYEIPESNFVSFKRYTYTTKIVEVKNETEKYKYKDEARSNFSRKLQEINMNFESDVTLQVRDREKFNSLINKKAEITKVGIMSFKSYKEASMGKAEYQN